MKNISTIIVSICLFFVSCEAPKTVKIVKTQQLMVLVYDISMSNDSYALLNKSDLSSVYSYIGANGGGKLYGLHILSNSTKQEPFVTNIRSLDTLELKGNKIQLGKIKKRNDKLNQAFEIGRAQFIQTAATALIKTKSEKFSDIENAMLLAKQIVEMPQYANWERSILLVSDMLNDFPPKNGLDSMKPLKLSEKVKFGVVRASPKVELPNLIPGVTITNYSTIEDGVKAILN